MIQRLEQIPAVCRNKECGDFNFFNLVDLDDVLEDYYGKGYVVCEYCKHRIYVD